MLRSGTVMAQGPDNPIVLSRLIVISAVVLALLVAGLGPVYGSPPAGFQKKFVPGGFVHVRYLYGEDDENEFLVTHARVWVKGSLNPWLGFRLHVDLVKDDVFKDAFADIRLAPWLKARCGQFKYRFGVFESPRDYATIYKPMVRSGLLGEPRDIGAALIGTPKPARFNVAILNGTAKGVAEDDTRKSVVATVLLDLVEGLEIGASIYEGTRDYYVMTDGHVQTIHGARRDRWGAHVWYEHSSLLVQAEYIRGYDHDIDLDGWYGILGYHVRPSVQTIVRVGYFDPDTARDDNGRYIYTAGLNWFADKACIVRVAHEIGDPESGDGSHRFTLQLALIH